MVDVVVTGRGHEARATVRPGGSAAIAAAWAAEAGADATVVGNIGGDFAGHALRSALEAQGLNCLLSIDEGAYRHLSPPGRRDPGRPRRERAAHARRVAGADRGRRRSRLGLPAPDTVAAALERADAGWIALSPGPLEPLPPGANALFVNEEEALRLTGEAGRRSSSAGRAIPPRLCNTRIAGCGRILGGDCESLRRHVCPSRRSAPAMPSPPPRSSP